MSEQSFKELKVWQESKTLAVEVYKKAAKGLNNKDHDLRDYMQKTAISIASSLAHGYERNSDKEFVRFLFIAKGTLGELRTQLEIAKDLDYLSEEDYLKLEAKASELKSLMTKLISYRKF